jgi:hypothetical protein
VARYIVRDNATGHIVGDTMDFEPTNTAYDDPFTACQDIDDEMGITNRLYLEQTRPFSKGEPGYFVFRGDDEDGNLLVPPITDRTDEKQIQLIWERCKSPDGVWFLEED